MGRAEVGTPKWVANKMKAKGLQKLRWYCQMCEKQCRDENGFKCHRMTEGHRRQMAVFAQRAGHFVDDFSRTFENSFMALMRTRYCRAKVLANTVYQDVISDKDHVHMNATRWTTLSEFVMYLKRTGKVHVEQGEMGLIISYIDRDRLKREQDERAKKKAQATFESEKQRLLEERVSQAWAGHPQEQQQQQLHQQLPTVPVCVTINTNNNDQEIISPPPPPPSSVFDEEEEDLLAADAALIAATSSSKAKSTVDKLLEEQRRRHIRR